MKRLLALLLTAGLTIGLTGCGPEQGEHSSQESSGAESSSRSCRCLNSRMSRWRKCRTSMSRC